MGYTLGYGSLLFWATWLVKIVTIRNLKTLVFLADRKKYLPWTSEAAASRTLADTQAGLMF